MIGPRTLLLAGLCAAVGLLVGGCYAENPRDNYNKCDWPNDCGGTVVTQLNEILSWVKADMNADRAKAHIYQQIAQAVERGKSPDLTNIENKHVCELKNPDPCEELRRIHDAARDAKNAAEGQSKPKWESVGTMIAQWPSGK